MAGLRPNWFMVRVVFGAILFCAAAWSAFAAVLYWCSA